MFVFENHQYRKQIEETVDIYAIQADPKGRS